MQDKFRKRYQSGGNHQTRIRRQIAVEAARRLLDDNGLDADPQAISDATEAVLYNAKRKAAAVLGHRVRPGDLPTDSEVRIEYAILARGKPIGGATEHAAPELDGELMRMSDHVDRFTIYKLKLAPLESIKQTPKHHPEGDALYHSLQVYELAKGVRPLDEEFLTAALLHDIGKAIDPANHARAGSEALNGAVTERTLWLIEHHIDAQAYHQKTLPPAERKRLEASEHFEDLMLLREFDEAGRIQGAIVPSIEEILDHLRNLDAESFPGVE